MANYNDPFEALFAHFLSAVSAIHARAAGAACDDRHDHCQPVHHHWRLLDDVT